MNTTTLVDRFLMTLQSSSYDTLQLDYRAFVRPVSYDATTNYKAFEGRFLMTLQSGSCDTLQLDYRAFVGRSLMTHTTEPHNQLQSVCRPVSYHTTECFL